MVKEGNPPGPTRPGGPLTPAVRGLGRPADVDPYCRSSSCPHSGANRRRPMWWPSLEWWMTWPCGGCNVPVAILRVG